MFIDFLQSKSRLALEKALDGAALSNRVIDHNLSNVETPGFKRSEVFFQDALRQALKGYHSLPLTTTHVRHLQTNPTLAHIRPQVVTDLNTSLRNDGNNVDIDAEQGALAKNSLLYQTLIRQYNGQLNLLKLAINEGK